MLYNAVKRCNGFQRQMQWRLKHAVKEKELLERSEMTVPCKYGTKANDSDIATAKLNLVRKCM